MSLSMEPYTSKSKQPIKAYIPRWPTLIEDTNDAEHTVTDGKTHDFPVQDNNLVQEQNVHPHFTQKAPQRLTEE